jgi:Tfp pilus assembly protein PilO
MNIGGKKRSWQVDLTGAGICAALTAIAYFTQIAPAVAQYHQELARAAILEDQQIRVRDLERSLRLAADQLEKTRVEARQSDFKLLPATELNSLLARLTEMAAKNHLRVDSLQSGQTTNLPRYSTVAVHLGGSGTYRNNAAAIHEIRATMPDVNIIGFRLASGGIERDTSATFSLDLLWNTLPMATADAK